MQVPRLINRQVFVNDLTGRHDGIVGNGHINRGIVKPHHQTGEGSISCSNDGRIGRSWSESVGRKGGIRGDI